MDQMQETSRQAYDSIQVELPQLEGRVYESIWLAGQSGLTCHEVEHRTGLAHQTASARIRDLREKGHLRDSGKRRPTGSGRAAIVWVVVR